MNRIAMSVFAAAVAVTAVAQVQNGTEPTPRRVALVVQNHAAPGSGIPVMALTDALTAQLSGRGLQVINPYNSIGVNQNRDMFGEKTPYVSAMALARQLKAHGAITASIVEFNDVLVGNPAFLHQYSMRITLNLADAQTGAAVCGETVKVKILSINEAGKINLSIKQVQPPAPRAAAPVRAQNQPASRGGFPGRGSMTSRTAPPSGELIGPSGDSSFEDKLKHFMQESDKRMAGNRLYSDRSRGRRRGK